MEALNQRHAALSDPLPLAQALIRCASVTPRDAGAMDLVQGWLEALGFHVRRMPFGRIENLYVRRGEAGPNLCFAGHLDVVPEGDAAAWSSGPFAGEVRDGDLYGRGAVDMKGGVAAWIAAVARTPRRDDVSLSLLITGDEEGEAIDGTRKVVEALISEGERVDGCVVGEPTSARTFGDMVKTGRRGSLNAWITVDGREGHVAYPDRAANPVPVLVALADRLAKTKLDDGFEGFQPSNLELTELEVGNPAHNVIPPHARARLNIRFNPAHTGADLTAWLERECAAAEDGFDGRVMLDARVSGEAFHTPPGPLTAAVEAAVREVTGRAPELSTTGGTSDARFIRALCPVVEFGLVGATMHKTDERTPVAELEALTQVYARLIAGLSAETFGAAAR